MTDIPDDLREMAEKLVDGICWQTSDGRSSIADKISERYSELKQRHGFCESQRIARTEVIADALHTVRMKERERFETKIAQAYHVIGNLLDKTGDFETKEGQRALDYFSDTDLVDEGLLPWPAIRNKE